MNRTRRVAGGGRAVEVAPERLGGWFARFADRNGGIAHTRPGADEVVVTAGNGATATVTVPFPPLDAPGDLDALIAHANAPRRIGLLLVRLGGHSVGVAEGGRVVVSRTAGRLVHGRSAAGGWSQQRFARRRDAQARQAVRAAASDAADVLGTRLPELDAVVLGGDRAALDEVRRDRRLSGVFALALPRVLDVAEPRRSVLDEAAKRALAVEVVVRDA
ncbi:acVLRF1 family peptidyl-tRNA hydrolase [Amycolatopsis sp. CA-230715]|uniref:acVLRF1 family peptidyl-tRNA hydrolase n=1 Tax=Amycolatopsis sp. CA-230715 TaxID=2745196 RepID=UPI001C00981C|nr:acVLRF1 family peptidyl-tRNA hydrolase [Amycolatopsis sp. CA-230715]